MKVEITNVYCVHGDNLEAIIDVEINGSMVEGFVIKNTSSKVKVVWRAYGNAPKEISEIKMIEDKVVRAYIKRMIKLTLWKHNLLI